MRTIFFAGPKMSHSWRRPDRGPDDGTLIKLNDYLLQFIPIIVFIWAALIRLVR